MFCSTETEIIHKKIPVLSSPLRIPPICRLLYINKDTQVIIWHTRVPSSSAYARTLVVWCKLFSYKTACGHNSNPLYFSFMRAHGYIVIYIEPGDSRLFYDTQFHDESSWVSSKNDTMCLISKGLALCGILFCSTETEIIHKKIPVLSSPLRIPPICCLLYINKDTQVIIGTLEFRVQVHTHVPWYFGASYFRTKLLALTTQTRFISVLRAHGYSYHTVYIEPEDTMSFYDTQFHDESRVWTLALESDNCRARMILCAYFPRNSLCAEYVRDLFD